MREERKNKSNGIVMVGGYRIIRGTDRFYLEKLDPNAKEFPDTNAFIFETLEEVRDVGYLLSLAFQRNTSTGGIRFKIGNLLQAEIVGGEHGSCKLYKLNINRKVDGEPIEANSMQGLVEALIPFFGNEG